MSKWWLSFTPHMNCIHILFWINNTPFGQLSRHGSYTCFWESFPQKHNSQTFFYKNLFWRIFFLEGLTLESLFLKELILGSLCPEAALLDCVVSWIALGTFIMSFMFMNIVSGSLISVTLENFLLASLLLRKGQIK